MIVGCDVKQPTIKSLERKAPTCRLHMETLWFQEVSICSTRVLLVPAWTLRQIRCNQKWCWRSKCPSQEFSILQISKKNDDLDTCRIENSWLKKKVVWRREISSNIQKSRVFRGFSERSPENEAPNHWKVTLRGSRTALPSRVQTMLRETMSPSSPAPRHNPMVESYGTMEVIHNYGIINNGILVMEY